jgi:putative transcriptional regulator
MKSAARPTLVRAAARAILASVVALGLAWSPPVLAESKQPLNAILLIAREGLPDPSFRDSIVLVMNNVGAVPAGVVLNRPTNVEVALLFPDFKGLAQRHDKVYFGGPVDIDSLWFVFAADKAPEHAIRVLEGVYISGDGDLLHKLLDRDKPMDGLRIYAGHSVWAPGQLESEIGRGDWTLAPADKDAIFHGRSEHPWPEEPEPDAGHRT